MTASQRYIFIVSGLYLLSLGMEGPIRYALSLANAGSLLYIRDLLVLIAILIYVKDSIIKNKNFLNFVNVSIYILCIYSIVALFNGQGIIQTIFGAKIYIALLLGCVCARSALLSESYISVAKYVWLATVVSVLVQRTGVNYPWIGLSYETAFGSVDAAKQWWAGGEVRNSGFARASYNAAMMIGVCAVYFAQTINSKIYTAAVVAVSLLAIYLTTTKGMLFAMIVTGAWLTLPRLLSAKYKAAQVVIGIMCIVCFIVPLLAVYADVAPQNSTGVPNALLSLWERFTWMWPKAFNQFDTPVQHLTGLGVGSVGTPQMMFHGASASAGDNLFVYQYSVFGMLSILFVGILVSAVLRGTSEMSGVAEWRTGMILILVLYGLTANLIEEPFFSFFLGLATGGAKFLNKKRETREIA